MIKIAYKTTALFLFIFQFNNFVYSQKQNYLGVNYTAEWTSNNNIQHSVGLLFEKQLTNCSGVETGLYLRTFSQDWNQTINTINYNVSISEVYCSLPILYKYYSKIVNIAIGPTFDYFIDWYQKDDNTNLKITSYTISPKLDYGLLLKISKSIQIADRFLIEPEVKYNPFLSNSKYYLGIGITAKYKL